MKNILENNHNNTYTLTLIDGRQFICKRWLEKKPNKEMWHVIIPKEAREACGRTYIRESYFENTDIYEFDNKTEHREGLGNNGWKSRLTEEELKIYEDCEKTMSELKELAMSREPKVLTEEEKLQREIAKLTKKLESLRG